MLFRLDYRVYRLPLPTPLRTAHGPWVEREGALVQLKDEAGRVGYGEAAPIPWFGTETATEAAAAIRALGDRVTAEQMAAVPERLGSVRFALDCAMAEGTQGLGRRLGKASSADETRPEAAFHPGRRLPVTGLLPAGRAVLAELPKRLEAGFVSFKWKVGVGDLGDELALLDDVLALLPTHAKLRLDANGGWDRRTAARWLSRCAERPVEFVEQPLAPADEDGLRGLAGDYPVSLALDEAVAGLAELRRWQAEGWPGVLVVKPALAGPWPDLVEWIRTSRADVVFSSAIETVVARAAILRSVLTGPELTQRALGFGVGEVFGNRCWDGPVIGPVLDAGWLQGFNLEDAWTALA